MCDIVVVLPQARRMTVPCFSGYLLLKAGQDNERPISWVVLVRDNDDTTTSQLGAKPSPKHTSYIHQLRMYGILQ